MLQAVAYSELARRLATYLNTLAPKREKPVNGKLPRPPESREEGSGNPVPAKPHTAILEYYEIIIKVLPRDVYPPSLAAKLSLLRRLAAASYEVAGTVLSLGEQAVCRSSEPL